MKKKAGIIAGVVLIVLLFVGASCIDSWDSVRTRWQGTVPGQNTRLYDEDGDGQPDTVIVVTTEGYPILDEAGAPVEVPGARADFVERKIEDARLLGDANLWDEAVAEEGLLWSEILGGTGLGAVIGLIFRAWGRRKPLREIARWQQNFRDLVYGIEQAREDQPEAWATLRKAIPQISHDARTDIAIIREEWKALKEALEAADPPDAT